MKFPTLAIACIGVACSFGTVNVSDALAQNAQTAGRPEAKTLTTKDGTAIHITYYKSNQGKSAPVVILLHGKTGNRLVWDSGFAKILNEQGFAVVTVDLRKHGQSKSKDSKDQKISRGDYQAMGVYDLPAVQDFIFDEHQAHNLNMEKTAIVAPEMSAPIALNFAAGDWLKRPYDDAPTLAGKTPKGQTIKSLILISPEANLPGITTGKAMNILKQPELEISWLFCVGDKDNVDKGQTEQLYQQVHGIAQNEGRSYLYKYPLKFRGTDLIGKRQKIELHMVVFLKKHLLELNVEWRDRRPRFDRGN